MIELHWLRPYYLLLLVVYLPLAWFSLRGKCYDTRWHQICDPQLLPSLLSHPRHRSQRWLRASMLLAGSMMIVGLAGPSFSRVSQPLIRQSQPVMIVLDASSVMNGQDIRPNRFKRATFLLQDLLNALPDNQWGLILYTSEPFLITPITQDKHTLSLLLQDMDPQIMPVDGNDLTEALAMAGDKLETAHNGGRGHILVISAEAAPSQAQKLAATLSKKGMNTSVIGMATSLGAPIFSQTGTQQMSRLPKESLAALAKAGNGQYASFDSKNPLPRNIMDTLKTKAQTGIHARQQGGWIWQDQGRYFILLILPIIAYLFRRGVWESL